LSMQHVCFMKGRTCGGVERNSNILLAFGSTPEFLSLCLQVNWERTWVVLFLQSVASPALHY
jgi:hypothetical protein